MTDVPAIPPVTDPAAQATQRTATSAPATAESSASRFDASMSEAGAAANAGDVATRFEAAFLTPLVTEILPPADSSVWGGGPGKMWRGLFAQEVAGVIAQSGGVGIAPIIEQAMTANKEVQQ